MTSLTLRNLILTLATLCDPQQSCDMCYATSPHVWHRGSNCAMCYPTSPTVGTKTQISRDVTHYYIRYPEVQLQDGVTLAPPFLKFYLFYRLFLHLANVSQFYSAISISPFVSYSNLRLTGCTSSFILRSPTIKTHVHRQPNITSLPLRTAQTSLQKTHPKLRILLARLRILSHFIAFHTLSPFALCCLLHFVTFCTLSPFTLCRTASCPIARHCSSPLLIASCHVKLDSFGNPLYIYIFSLISHSSHRLLKKGLTSTCTFLHFAGLSHCKCITASITTPTYILRMTPAIYFLYTAR
jgi:hypothetical protein